MNRQALFVTLSIFLLLNTNIPSTAIPTPNPIILPDAELSSAELFENTLSILENRADKSLDFESYSDDTGLVYYSSVGLAGIGYNLLLASDMDTSWIGSGIDARLVTLATKIGDQLISLASIDNATHAIWSVNNQTSSIDLSLDFGLAGIARFFTKLYNSTATAIYGNYATKTLRSITDLASGDNDNLFFEFDVTLPYDNFWYPQSNFQNYLTTSEIFTGISYGSAGISLIAMEYLRDSNIANTSLGSSLLTRSLNWLWSQRIENGSELAFNTNKDNSSLLSTSYASGMAGIGGLYLDLFEYTGNTTYLDNAWMIGQWFNGTVKDEERTDFSWSSNGVPDNDLEIGLHLGIAGIVKFLDHLYDYNSSVEMRDFVITNTNAMRVYGLETNGMVQFGEREQGGLIRDYGSTSYSFGGGGIFKLMNDVGVKYNVSNLLEFATKAKKFLTSQVDIENGLYGIIDDSTGLLETNPMQGMSASLLYLNSLTSGLLRVDTSSIDFGILLVGGTSTKSIPIYNDGDSSIEVIWNNKTSIFDYDAAPIVIGAKSSYLLNITFNPDDEAEYIHTINISALGVTRSILLTGSSFDRPELVYEGPQNNTVITSFVAQDFLITASDTSGIAAVTMNVRNENGTVITSSQMIKSGGKYSSTWETKDYINGTYIIEFVATDTLGNTNSLRYMFTMGVYTSRIDEQIFNPQTFVAILTGIAVLLVIAIIITRRMRK